MIVLSLFDGMSCGQIALNRICITPAKYYAAEVDKYAIKVTQANYPNTIQMGDVTNWREWDIDWSSIDLLIGGSPCQGFSFAGKQLAFDDQRSKLFFVYVDILNHIKSLNPDVKFMLENVKMKKEYLAIISEQLGVDPVFINSNLVSAQNRQRYYWANWKIEQPEDRGILLADILEDDFVDRDKSHCLDANYYKGGNLKSYFEKHRRQLVFMKQKPRGNNKGFEKEVTKCPTISANAWEHNNHIKTVEFNDRIKDVTENDRGIRYNKGDKAKSGISELGRILKPTAKYTDALTTSHMPKIALNSDVNKLSYRKLTPIECERLQTVPDNATALSLSIKTNETSKGITKCGYVSSKDAISQSQVKKLNCAISTILDLLGSELPKSLESMSIKLKFVNLTDATTSNKRLKVFVSNITNLGSENSQLTHQKNAKVAMTLLDLDQRVTAQSITANYLETEIQLSQNLESLSRMEILADDTLKHRMVDGFIRSLLNMCLDEKSEKEKLCIMLTLINTIIVKAIYMSANQIPITYKFIGNLKILQGSSLEMDLSYLETVNIGETSSSNRYKMLGNGWTVDVIAHIFSSLKINN